MKIYIVLILATAFYSISALKCHKCTSQKDCGDSPVGNCGENEDYCYSVTWEAEEPLTVKSCGEKEKALALCDNLKHSKQVHPIKYCYVCNADVCNTKDDEASG